MAELKQIVNVGSVGYIAKDDARPFELPYEAWSDVKNIRFHNGAAQVTGAANCVSQIPTAVNPDYFTEFTYFRAGTDLYWLLFGSEKCYALRPSTTTCGAAAATTTLLTSAISYTGSSPYVWVIDKIFGNVVATPQSVPPYYYGSASTFTSTLAVLPGWTAEFGSTSHCYTVATAKGFILAGNITSSGTGGRYTTGAYPTRVAWSERIRDTESFGHTIPQSWDASDATKLTGAFDLPSDTGSIIAMKSLRDDVIVYTERAIYRIWFVGGKKVWDYRLIYTNQGIYGPKCVSEFNGNHFIIGTDDILVFDGQSIRSVADKKTRRDLFNVLTHDMRARINIGVDSIRSEIHVLYPSNKELQGVDRDLVWSWEDETWTKRDLETSENRRDGSYVTIMRENLTIDSGISDPDVSSKSWGEFGDEVTWNSLPDDETWGASVASLGDLDMYTLGYIEGDTAVTFEDYLLSLNPQHVWKVDEDNTGIDPTYGSQYFYDSIAGPSINYALYAHKTTVDELSHQALKIPSSSNYSLLLNADDVITTGSLMGLQPRYGTNAHNSPISGQSTFGLWLRKGIHSYPTYAEHGIIRFPAKSYDGNTRYINFYVDDATGSIGYWRTSAALGHGTATLISGTAGTFLVSGDEALLTFILRDQDEADAPTKIDVYVDDTLVLEGLDLATQRDGSGIYAGSPSHVGSSQTPTEGANDFILFFGFIDEIFVIPNIISANEVGTLFDAKNNVVIPDKNTISRVDSSYNRIESFTNTIYSQSESYLEKQQIDLTGDPNTAVILGVYPKIGGSYPINIYVGHHNNSNDDPHWHGPYTFDPTVDYKINCRVRGRRHALKFEAIGAPTRLFGYDIEYEPSGRRKATPSNDTGYTFSKVSGLEVV